MRHWSKRRWLSALGSASVTVIVVAIPTAMIPTPIFGRDIAVTWWAWPTLIVTAVLGGLVFATYVRERGVSVSSTTSKGGIIGAALTYFAVGCPVCNKIVLLALGYTGALTWFAPIQPLLGIGGVVLLAVALRARLKGEIACPVPATAS